MHDPACQGAEFFRCDFCARPWAPERQMIEGHQGSLICQDCLAVVYASIVIGEDKHCDSPGKCVMCLEERSEPMWTSPVREEAKICRRCARQGATRMDKDPDVNWSKPAQAPSAG